ncbi:hypothetical protein GA0070216_10128 [Micromonospora matsumotoense]|uniref:DUF11 domain-containing protein n=1 Tax=Micromonospora matsumotoense TaxID=121616 RepID=A0A1C4TWA9_9ACTN|nr:hypothetical protein [Micromonospora matsumotoense]SCE63723.1 hypothetical protein GA0070216_10128 [Micromonospora matsumotoense]
MRVRTLAASLALAIGGVLTVAVPASAHPVLNLSASPATVTAGSTVTLTISGTSNGNYTGARIEVFSSTPSKGGTTGSLTSFTSSPSCGGTPGTPTCTEITNRYKIGNITLTNSQAFSYTVTFTVDSATTAGTFTSKAQFYKSDTTTDGPTTGPLITVTPATADLAITKDSVSFDLEILTFSFTYVNNGPAATTTPLTYSTGPSPSGFASEQDNDCVSGAGESASCDLNFSIAANDSGLLVFRYSLSLFVLGNYTVTATLLPANDSNTANNTVVWNCTAVTALIVNCT